MSIMFQLLSFTSTLTCFFFLLVLVAYWKRNKARGTILKSPPGPWKRNISSLIFVAKNTFCCSEASSYRELTSIDYLRIITSFFFKTFSKETWTCYAATVGWGINGDRFVTKSSKRGIENTWTLFCTKAWLFVSEFLSYDYSGILASPYGDCWIQMRKICVLELLTAQRVHSFRSVRE